MSTRSLVGIQNTGGKNIRFIYVHSDGYVDGVGKTLHKHFKTRQKVFRLISNGDASSIGPRINPRKNRIHTFDKSQNDVCRFYRRERGKTDCESKLASSFNSFKNKMDNYFAQYAYYLDNNNVWWVSSGEDFTKLEEHFPSPFKKISLDLTFSNPITFGPKLSTKSGKILNPVGFR